MNETAERERGRKMAASLIAKLEASTLSEPARFLLTMSMISFGSTMEQAERSLSTLGHEAASATEMFRSFVRDLASDAIALAAERKS